MKIERTSSSESR